MKKLGIMLSFIALVGFVNAQQAATATTTQATPVVKVDAKPSTINAATPAPATGQKAACSGHTEKAACTGHSEKAACTKGAAAPACCQKNGGAAGCSHASTGEAPKQ